MDVDVQAQGLKLKSKTLEDVMKSTFKTEPKLIGYDETPIDVTDTTTIGQVMVNGDLRNKANTEIRPIQKVSSDASSSYVKPVAQQLQSSPKGKLSETIRNRDCVSDSSKTGNIKKYCSTLVLPNSGASTYVLLILTVLSHYLVQRNSKIAIV